MAKLQNSHVLKSQRGQSAVEYILLLAVISALSVTLINNRRFKEFIGGEAGLFVGIRKGMEYSYRYGRALSSDEEYDESMNFNYQTNKHDTYFNAQENSSRFFGGAEPYGQN